MKKTNLVELDNRKLKISSLLEDETVKNQPAEPTENEPMVEMKAEANLAEAGCTILLKYLKKLHKNEAIAREGQDPEGVHQLRVATRHLRAGLKVLEETVYEPEQMEYFRRGLRRLAHALGEARDADVLLEHVEQYENQLPGEKVVAFEPLRQMLRTRREDSYTMLVDVLDRKKTARLLSELKDFLHKPEQALKAEDDNEATVARPLLVRHFSGSSIWRRYEEVLAFETKEPLTADFETLHRLRIACKRLRYTLEFFEDALPDKSAKVLDQLKQVQEHLGTIQDHRLAVELIERFQAKQEANPVLQDYLNSRSAERDQLVRNFDSDWHKLSGTDFRRQLAGLLY